MLEVTRFKICSGRLKQTISLFLISCTSTNTSRLIVNTLRHHVVMARAHNSAWDFSKTAMRDNILRIETKSVTGDA
jgi:hypothetical protein